jgi:hypothetical protein
MKISKKEINTKDSRLEAWRKATKGRGFKICPRKDKKSTKW